MAQALKLSFRNATGKSTSLRFDDPKTDLTPEQVIAAMDQVIASNAFTSTGGDFVAKLEAVIIETTENLLYQAE